MGKQFQQKPRTTKQGLKSKYDGRNKNQLIKHEQQKNKPVQKSSKQIQKKPQQKQNQKPQQKQNAKKPVQKQQKKDQKIKEKTEENDDEEEFEDVDSEEEEEQVEEEEKDNKKQDNDEDDDEEDDDEINDEDVSIDEEAQKALEDFAKAQVKSKSESKKVKERKVMDFKFRVLDLVDLFIKKTQQPELFLTSIIPFFETIKSYSRDKAKANFTEKLCNIIRKFFEKNHSFKIEYKENVDECIKTIFSQLAKISKKHIQKTFQFALFNLIKIRIEMDKEDKEFVTFYQEQLEAALQRSGQKRDIFYTEQFYRDIFKTFPEMSQSALPSLINYSNLKEFGGEKDIRRKFILEIVHYVAKIYNLSFVKENKNSNKEVDEAVEKLISGAFTNFNSIKSKKYSDLRKYSEIITNLMEISKRKIDLKDKIIQVIKGWEEDKNIAQFRQKLLEKLEGKQEKQE